MDSIINTENELSVLSSLAWKLLEYALLSNKVRF